MKLIVINILAALILTTVLPGPPQVMKEATEPTITKQELEAFLQSPDVSPATTEELELLVSAWSNLVMLNNADGVISVSTQRFRDQTFGSTENLQTAFATPGTTQPAYSQVTITVRDARQVDSNTVMSFVHVAGFEDSDPDPGRVYFGIFKREAGVWKIDYLRPDLYVVDENSPDTVIKTMSAADYERDTSRSDPAVTPAATAIP